MSTLPSPCIRGDEYFLTKCGLVTDLVRNYANPLATAGVRIMGSGTVIWQTGKSNDGVRRDLKKVEKKVDKIVKDLSTVERKVDMTNDNILTVTREATKAMETRNYKGMHTLAARIERCQKSGGKDCE